MIPTDNEMSVPPFFVYIDMSFYGLVWSVESYSPPTRQTWPSLTLVSFDPASFYSNRCSFLLPLALTDSRYLARYIFKGFDVIIVVVVVLNGKERDMRRITIVIWR